MEKHIAAIRKNATEEVHVALTEFRGHQLIDVRVYFRKDVTGEMLPTKKGITVEPEILPELIEAMVEATRAAGR